MDLYITQLIEDLDSVAKNPPPAPFIEHQIDDWDEKPLCIINRHDQKDNSDFV